MNTRILGLVLLVLAIFSALVYKFAHDRLAEQSLRMLEYTYVTQSPDKKYLVGFFEDCSGAITRTNNTGCVRLVYTYNTVEHTRSACDLYSGSMSNTPIFEDLSVKWQSNSQLYWSSSWAKTPINLGMDRTLCLDFSSFWDQFELIPTLSDSLERLRVQDEKIAKQRSERLIRDAMRSIKVE